MYTLHFPNKYSLQQTSGPPDNFEGDRHLNLRIGNPEISLTTNLRSPNDSMSFSPSAEIRPRKPNLLTIALYDHGTHNFSAYVDFDPGAIF